MVRVGSPNAILNFERMPSWQVVRGSVGEWLSLVEHLVRDQGVGGSNPLSPTMFSPLEKHVDLLHIPYSGTNSFSIHSCVPI